MKLVITIDTEEDNWNRYSTTNNPVKNIEYILRLQRLFDQYQVKPTYLISYPVATDERSGEILKEIADQKKCEIGMHCHPWNTPPFEEEISDYNSMLCNLPEALVLKKLTVLHETICEKFNITPVSFRAGRWGFGSAVARAIHKLGYHIDTSVSPFVNWNQYHGPDFRRFRLHPYRFEPDDIAIPEKNGPLLEIPATVGFLQGNYSFCQQCTEYIETNIGKKLRIKGILGRLGLLNKVWLSPELSDAGRMIKLADRMNKMSYPSLTMSFHSTSLMAGLSPFVKNRDDESLFMQTIETFLIHAVNSGWTGVTLKELAASLE